MATNEFCLRHEQQQKDGMCMHADECTYKDDARHQMPAHCNEWSRDGLKVIIVVIMIIFP